MWKEREKRIVKHRRAKSYSMNKKKPVKWNRAVVKTLFLSIFSSFLFLGEKKGNNNKFICRFSVREKEICILWWHRRKNGGLVYLTCVWPSIKRIVPTVEVSKSSPKQKNCFILWLMNDGKTNDNEKRRTASADNKKSKLKHDTKINET